MSAGCLQVTAPGKPWSSGALELWTGFDSEFYSLLKNLAKTFNRTPWGILETCLKDFMADTIAEEEVWGRVSERFQRLMILAAAEVVANTDSLKLEHIKRHAQERRSYLEVTQRMEAPLTAEDEQWLKQQYEREHLLAEQRQVYADARRKGEISVASTWESED